MFLQLSVNTDIVYAWNPAFTISPRVLSKKVPVGSVELDLVIPDVVEPHAVFPRAPSSKHQILAAELPVPVTSRKL